MRALPDSTEIETTERGSLSRLQAAVGARQSGSLLVNQGEGVGRTFEVRETPLVVGRSSDCDIRLLNRAVSRLHFRVWRDSTGYWLRDLNSTNRTFLNDRPVVEARLKDGDVIAAGGTVFLFSQRSDADIPVAAPPAPAPDVLTVDGHTGLMSRAQFELELDREIARSRRHERSFVVALLDVDRLGHINTAYGQRAGDEALRIAGRMVVGGIRVEDCAARLGGDDLAVLLTETTLEQALPILQSIRSAISNTPLDAGGTPFRVTVSGAVTCWSPTGGTRSELMLMLDRLLARAKAAGGNQLVSG
jgi:diguanylate cyclase (GGDEF)-like protein